MVPRSYIPSRNSGYSTRSSGRSVSRKPLTSDACDTVLTSTSGGHGCPFAGLEQVEQIVSFLQWTHCWRCSTSSSTITGMQFSRPFVAEQSYVSASDWTGQRMQVILGPSFVPTGSRSPHLRFLLSNPAPSYVEFWRKLEKVAMELIMWNILLPFYVQLRWINANQFGPHG